VGPARLPRLGKALQDQAHGGYREEQHRVEIGQVRDLELRGSNAAKRSKRVAPEVVSCLVVPGPQEWEGGHGHDGHAGGLQLARKPLQRSGVILDVLEHVEHAHDVKASGDRLGNDVLDDHEAGPELFP